jgi:hypothetical protein
VIGVSICGLPEAIVGQIVRSVAEQQERLQDFVPIFLTDSTDFQVFRRHGFVFEYFPNEKQRAAYGGSVSWSEYGRQRRELLERKWGIAQTISFGPTEFGRIPTKVEEPDGNTNATLGRTEHQAARPSLRGKSEGKMGGDRFAEIPSRESAFR